MWSHVVLFFLVGLAFASNNPGWTDNQEYVYKVRGRTLTGLAEVANQYVGILFKATLRIQPRNDGQQLQALITNPKYAQIHDVLPDAWKTQFQDEELNWKPLPMKERPFQIQMKNGLIDKIVVCKDMKNWEANMLKGIVSVFQINVNGERALPRSLNVLPSPESNDAIFMAMEDTVSGETETLYEIRPVPQHLFDETEKHKNFQQWKKDGEIIEVYKHKNYTNEEELPAFIFGFGDQIEGLNPAETSLGDIISRDSTGRAILVGDLRRHVIVNTTTTETIYVKPAVIDKQKAAIVSVIRADLEEIKSQNEKIESVPQPFELDNLVYSYGEPFETNGEVYQTKKAQRSQGRSQNYNDDDEEYSRIRNRRSLRKSSDDYSYYFTLDKIETSKAPPSPLLAYYTGHQGQSIKKAGDLVHRVVKLAKQIGKDLQSHQKEDHEKTLDRFVNLNELCRLMDKDEFDQATQQLYSKNAKGEEKAAWAAYRDALAETGTGPAFLSIESWIESDKVEGDDAAQLVSTVAKITHHPTLDYMKKFFQFTKKEKVLREWPLNDTALISYAHLIRKVYVDDELSRSELPVHAFGPFDNEEGEKFIKEEVIPYYSEMLKKSIERADTPKIHAYIATLGKIGAPEVLSAFEPYLEGNEKASQFQRLMMVLSLRDLVEIEPEKAFAVLYRLYQNPGEHPTVRIACVYFIMRTKPTAEILQLMAQSTKTEKNEYVKAAVKHSIEQISELEDSEEYAKIIRAAKIAKSHLTNEHFGVNYGGNYLRAYVIEELNKHFRITTHLYPAADSYLPKGIMYSVRSNSAGLHRKNYNARVILSSIDQLINVAFRQTKAYDRQQQEQKSNAQQQGQHPWSSQHIAELLNMKAHEREQLEGFLSLEIGAPHRMFGFDNTTMKRLPKFVEELEAQLRNGQKIEHYKTVDSDGLVVAVPTAMGIPCVYHYTSPMIIKAKGEVMAVANPQLSQGNKLQRPQQVKIDTEMEVTVTGKTIGRLMFVAPFEQQIYISGYDKHWEFNLPTLKAQMKIDLQEQEVQVEIQPKEENKVNMFHYHTWPYTAMTEVTSDEPLTSQRNMKYIEPENMQEFKTVVGKQSTGIALEVAIRHERKNLNAQLIRRLFSYNGAYDALRELWDDASIQNSQIDISYLPQQSINNKIVLRSKYNHDYVESPEPREGKWELNEKAEPAQRQQELMKVVAAKINNVDVSALDNIVEFQGQRNIQYLLTGALAKSNVDPKAHMRVCFKRSSPDNQVKDYEMHFVAHSEAENTNGMDLEDSLQSQPQMDTEIEVSFGQSEAPLSKLKAKIQHKRSEERKRYLTESHLYKQCLAEMEQGDKALSACTKINMIANLLDRADIKIRYENLSHELKEDIQMAFDAGRVLALPNAEIESKQTPAQDKEVMVHVKFHGDLQYFNATIQTKDEETALYNIPVGELTQQVLVPHPVFPVPARVLSQIFGADTYRDFCTVDQTQINTFSNRTYDAELSNRWTVMALYAPKQAREQGQEHAQLSLKKQLQEQAENFVVLVRESKQSQDKKDVKIVASAPRTKYQVVEIELKPGQGRNVEVAVNGKPVTLNKKQSQDIFNGYVQMYALPNGEVKVEIQKAFYILFDGERVRMTTVHDKFKDATRGLCGQYNDQDAEDFLAPQDCIAAESKKFIRSFEVEGEQGQQIRKQFAGEDNQCVEIEPVFVNVITKNERTSDYFEDDESRHFSQYSQSSTHHKSNRFDESSQYGDSEETKNNPKHNARCLFKQTRYVKQNGKICFTIEPVVSCRSQCRPRNFTTKTVGVHCINKSNVSDLWKNQIDNENSPDFSSKEQHRTVEMSVPQSCSA
ncbi:unnamed protein product [Phyllotreta striolata]|uniref:Vitellogenin n=1 Tax=Phyllotreta striolata TaxID=444603 RepID=A0A9N9XJR7_PHYSR|nr:unnamed protein product [Phyllotreta striolata]